MSKLIDLTGKIYDKWYVIERAPDVKDMTYWLCKCKCKIIKPVSSRSLRNGTSTRCDQCKIGSESKLWTGYKQISGQYWASIESRVKRKKQKLDITIEYIWDLFETQNQKCALTGESLRFSTSHKDRLNQTASLDRIDSSKGYIKGNLQWVHKDINRIKQNFSQQAFITLCKKIAAFNQYHKLKGQVKWDHRFIDLAQTIAGFSKDPSTRVGAVITNNHKIISMGYNGLARGIQDTTERLNDRETKYRLTIHGEINAILNTDISVRGCNLYVWPLSPCSDCMKMIIQCDIKRIIYPTASNELYIRWGESLDLAIDMAHEAGIELIEL